jgi:hypothetical protein
LFTLEAAEMRLTDTKQGEKAENFKRFGAGDVVTGDRAYGNIRGIAGGDTGHRRLLCEGMGGVEDWADLARGRYMTAVREMVVSAIPRGSGPGEGV